ncbi:MAG: MBL fold metallo-hydrolase [Alphaproteobacteria bacterium]|nr:MBL fold metallo-hydrolase [Alphaproteobacteria bacterium]
MRLTFIGSGDAFGSGGRFNTCFMVRGRRSCFLIDCGATSLIALKRAAVDLDALDGVILTHLHGDHFGGLPFLLLDAQLMSKRRRPFFIWGPDGFKARLAALREALFPGSSTVALKFAIETAILRAGIRHQSGGIAVTPYLAVHSAGSPCFALRVECDGKIITYSGDTAWTETLIDAGRGADLFICECSSFDRDLPGHLSWRTLAAKLPSIGARRVVLTHMNPDMLAQAESFDVETASDGLTLAV